MGRRTSHVSLALKVPCTHDTAKRHELAFYSASHQQPQYINAEMSCCTAAGRVAARQALRRGLNAASARRWNGTAATKGTAQAAQGSSGPMTFLLSGVVGAAAGVGAYFYTSHSSNGAKASSSSPSSSASEVVPSIAQALSEKGIAVESPVKPLDLRAVDVKLRRQAQTFTFESRGGKVGRVDVVRVPSNDPVEDDWSVGVGEGVGGKKTLFAGVYDGHAGWATSMVLRKALIPYVSTSIAELDETSTDEMIDAAIKDAFDRLDHRIMANAKDLVDAGADPASADVIAALAPVTAGSCAILSMYEPATSTVRTACTGDSRAVLGSWSAKRRAHAAEALSQDQTGFNKAEFDRITREHPGEEGILDPSTGRLLGIAITRAFGDHRWKWSLEFLEHLKGNYFDVGPRPKYLSPPYMTATPEVTTRRVETSDFVILASDGLWDHMTNDDAVACVSRWLAAQRAGGRAEPVADETETKLRTESGWASWSSRPEDFAIEDMDSAAVCLVKNAFGGRRRGLLRGVVSAEGPGSRYARDDVTVQVIFFDDPYHGKK